MSQIFSFVFGVAPGLNASRGFSWVPASAGPRRQRSINNRFTGFHNSNRVPLKGSRRVTIRDLYGYYKIAPVIILGNIRLQLCNKEPQTIIGGPYSTCKRSVRLAILLRQPQITPNHRTLNLIKPKP